MKNFAAIFLLLFIVIGAGVFTGMIGIRYPRVIENQPLRNPIEISNVDGSFITLSDGRVLELEDTSYHGGESVLLSPGKMIDVEVGAPNQVIIWGNKPGWVCGTPWARPIRIPLLADNVYRNRREMLTFATFKESRTKAEQAAAGQPATRIESK